MFRIQKSICRLQDSSRSLNPIYLQEISPRFKQFSLAFLLVAMVLIVSPAMLHAQQVRTNEPVSMTVVNEPLSSIMERLSRNAGVNFSYNPDQLNTSKTYTFSHIKRPLSELLDLLFRDAGFGYRLNGNQIVIFSMAPDQKKEEEKPAPGKVTPTLLRDTVYMTKTILRTDTLTLTLTRKDTVTRFDTVFIMRTAPENRIGKGDIFSDIRPLGEELTRELRIYAGAGLTWLAGHTAFASETGYDEKAEEYRIFHSDKAASGSLGLEVHAGYNRFSVVSGLLFTAFSQNFNYKYEISSGGFYRKDTLDAYYTLPGADTAWFYIVDSVYIPVDVQKFGYKAVNRRNYFEIPFTVQYNFPVSQVLIYLRSGVIAGISSGNKGMYINYDGEGAGDLAGLVHKPVVFSFVAGAGVMMPVHKKLIFQSGLLYRTQLQSVYKDFPIKTRHSALGINAGLLFKF